MEGWIIILAIALLRGLGAWQRRRQQQQRKAESQGAGQRRPVPGDPDVFDADEFESDETDESEWTPPWEPRQPPPLPQPRSPLPTNSDVTFTEEDRRRQTMLQRLAQAAEMAQASASIESEALGGEDMPHPHAGSGASISHLARRARNLQDALLSPRRIRQALLLNEVLGPPVSKRGPLRGPGSQPR